MRYNMERTKSDIDFHTYGRPHNDERSPSGCKRRSLEPESQMKHYLKAPVNYSNRDPDRNLAVKVTQRDEN